MPAEPSHFPYHHAVLDYFRSHESVRWQAFHDGTEVSDRESRQLLQLRKSARRLELRDALPWLHEAVTTGVGADLGSPVVCYLATTAPQMQVRVIPLLDQPRLVIEGPLLETLSQDEVRSLVAVELTRYQFWQQEGGDYLAVKQLLTELLDRQEVPASHEMTARRFALCTDLLSDQGSLREGNAETLVAAWIKCRPLPDSIDQSLDAAGLLEQAESLCETVDQVMTSQTQRDLLLRIAALQKIGKPGFDVTQLESQVVTAKGLDDLDLLQQLQVMNWTRELICCLLQPSWIQTPAVISYARSYFADLRVDELLSGKEAEVEQLLAGIRQLSPGLKEYFCFMLLDFSAADRELQEAPLALVIDWTERLGVTDVFRELAQRELRLRKTQFSKIFQERDQILKAAEGGGA